MLRRSHEVRFPIIGRTEIRAPRLIAAGRAGGDAVLAAFGRSDARMTQQLVPVDSYGRTVSVRLGSAPDAGAERARSDGEAP